MLLDAAAPGALAQASHALVQGQLVAIPTETVYGLAARADDDAAVAHIFSAKGRPADHPLIVHVADAEAAHHFAAEVPEVARRLMQAFWPGPLTVIVRRREGVATAAAGGQPTVGLRCPAHPIAQALLRDCARQGVYGLAAPSANRFGRVSPTQAQHVASEFGPELLILDGGACEVGIESSIVDCSRGAPVLLRPGLLTRAKIEAAAGEVLAQADASAPKASGTLEAHYAPQALVRLMSAAQIQARLGDGAAAGVAVYSRTALPQAVWRRSMPSQAAAAAHELFAALRELDALGAKEIWIEIPPSDSEWDGVRDRLTRAAAAFASPAA
ncbi:L-threonylcarbamoyladenylate synthase [Roseateles sp. BYS180W]|uniref:Threonylcarbamoyl-AMP synthase n=1 Tax=Roseateles rivi TaxID=3299028 RepID=A0ABW7FWL2_9BURK